VAEGGGLLRRAQWGKPVANFVSIFKLFVVFASCAAGMVAILFAILNPIA
jgi:hypothetical protein